MAEEKRSESSLVTQSLTSSFEASRLIIAACSPSTPTNAENADFQTASALPAAQYCVTFEQDCSTETYCPRPSPAQKPRADRNHSRNGRFALSEEPCNLRTMCTQTTA